MTLKELHFFYQLCDNPQVTQLAQSLQISQSAISLAIKSLETKLILGDSIVARINLPLSIIKSLRAAAFL